MIRFAAIAAAAAIAAGTNPLCALPGRCPRAPETVRPVYAVSASEDASASAAVEAYAQEVLHLVNSERASAGLAPLTLDPALCAAAQIRAEEIDVSFSHTRPDGKSGFTVLKELKTPYLACGENIAKGSPTPGRVMEGWMHSSGHRANILHPHFTSIGIGLHRDTEGVLHWVQLFTA